MNRPAPGAPAPTRPTGRRLAAAGSGTSLIALALVPKCGLCVAAWLAALTGLSTEMCGPGLSWSLLAAEAELRLRLTGPALAAYGALVLVAAALLAGALVLRRLPGGRTATPT